MGDLWRKNIPEDFDGRFGEKFDDEVHPKEILQISAGILAICVVAIIFCIGVIRFLEGDASSRYDLPPSPIEAANERAIPGGPLLQAKPETEMEALREEMAEHLHGYGWMDEAHGIVHIPIDKAIEMVVAGAAPQSVEAPLAEEATEGEPTSEVAAEPVAEGAAGR